MPSTDYGKVFAGPLQRRLTIESKDTTQRNSDGQVIPGKWFPVATVWAEIRPMSGREQFNASQQKAIVSHIITIRHPRSTFTVKPDMRGTHGGRVFNFVSVLNIDEQDRRLVIQALEVQTPENS